MVSPFPDEEARGGDDGTGKDLPGILQCVSTSFEAASARGSRVSCPAVASTPVTVMLSQHQS